MLSLTEQKKLFAEEFGFEPMIEEPSSTPSVTKTALPDFDAQKKLFAEEFGFEPQIEEPPQPEPVRQVAEPAVTREPEQRVPISTGVTRSFEEPISTGVTKEFGTPAESEEDRFKIKPEPAVQEQTATITDPLIEEKYKAVAESESALAAGAKEAGLALTYGESPVSKYRRQEHPVTATVGQVVGTVAPMLAGGTGVMKAMSNVPKLAQLANAGKAGKVAFSGLARMTTAAMDYIARHNDELLSEDENVKADAKKNLAINLAASAASPLPETFLPTNWIQPVAQGATDLLVETIGQAVAGDNAFSEENIVNTIVSTVAGSLFGLADVKGVDANTKNIINEIENKIDIPKERSEKLNTLIRQSIEKAQTPAKSKVIEPEAPEFKTETLPSGLEVTRNIRQPPTETDLKTTVAEPKGKPYIEGYEHPTEPQQIPTASPGEPGREVVPPYAEPKSPGAPAGEGLRGKAAESGWQFGDTRQEIESVLSETSPQTFDSRINETVSAEIDRLNYEEIATPAKPEEPGIELPERRRGILSEAGAVGEKGQRKLTDADPNPETVRVQQILDKQRTDVKNKFHKSFKQKIRNAVDFIGEQFVDRVYYAKRLLGKTPEAKNVIGKVNASKGNSAESKIQYETAEKEISNKLPHDLEHTFEDYLQAKRILEIEEVKGEGKVKHTGGMGIDEANKIVDIVENKYSPEESAAIKTSADRYWQEMDNQLKQLKDNGLLSDESYSNLSTQGRYYSPRKFLQHIDPESTITTPQGKRISVRESGIKSLGEGSEEAMVNNWRLLLSEVISRTQSRIFKNKASSALADFVNKNPENLIGAKIDTDPTAKLPTGMERIFYMENGESKAVLVPEKFAKSWNQNDQALNATTATLLHYGSGSFLVRPLATGALAPEFALTNIPRDIALQWLSTKEYSRIAPVAIFQNFDNMRRVFRDAWTGEGRYRKYVAEGGGMEFLNEQGSFLSKDPTKPMTASSERNRQIFRAFSKLQEFSERLTRLALREQAIKNGKSPEEATRIAREYLDFAQGGSFTKAANNAVPYLNASVQGTRSVARAFIDDPINTSVKALQLMAMGGALAYTANHFRKDEWDKISDREKVTRWNFPTGMSYTNAAGDKIDTYFSIPKDQSSRIFATIGETAAEMQQGIIDGKTAWNRISMAFDDLSPVDMLGLLPPSISAIMGYALNKDFWLREDIWKDREVSPYMEYYEGKTPEAYIDLAEKLNDVGIKLSPARLHSSMRQVMPANPVTALMGGAYDQITAQIEGKEKEKLNQSVMERISKMPGARKYFHSTYPSRTDYEKLVKDLKKYRISLYDESGEKKNERTLKREIKEAEIKLGDIRQKFDNEARIISGLFLSKNPEEAQQKWISLRNEAYKKLGRKEVKRIERRIETWIKKRSGSVYKEAIK